MKPPSGEPKIHAGARKTASPATPPSPVGSGHDPICGNVEANAAARNVATIHSRPRHFSPTGLCEISRQPSSSSGTRSRIEARPSSCIARSAKIAPGKPRRLWMGFCVAWLRDGSWMDQVASAMAPRTDSEISARPASSLSRRRMTSRKCSETKVMMSRLRSAARMRLHPYPRTATRRCSASAVAALS